MRGRRQTIGLVAIAILALAISASLVGHDSLAFQSPQPTIPPSATPTATPVFLCDDGCPLPWWVPEYLPDFQSCRPECFRCSAGPGGCGRIFEFWLECDQTCMETWNTSPLVPPGVDVPALPVALPSATTASPAPTATPKPDYCFVFGFPCTNWNPGAPEGCMCWCDAPMWCPPD